MFTANTLTTYSTLRVCVSPFGVFAVLIRADLALRRKVASQTLFAPQRFAPQNPIIIVLAGVSIKHIDGGLCVKFRCFTNLILDIIIETVWIYLHL
jgi:hypothetical protein